MLISVDHGNKLIKVLHHAPFTSGLQESDTPPFGGETLKYQGKYYTLSEKRIPYHRDKTEDDRFWILTLFAIAYEIEAVGGYSQNIIRIQLAVGLPRPTTAHNAKRLPRTLPTGALSNLSSGAGPIPSISKRLCASLNPMPLPRRFSAPSARFLKPLSWIWAVSRRTICGYKTEPEICPSAILWRMALFLFTTKSFPG